jgi:hypothetical protein
LVGASACRPVARRAFFDGAAPERSFRNGQAARFRRIRALTIDGDHIGCRRIAPVSVAACSRSWQTSNKASCAEKLASNRSMSAAGGDPSSGHLQKLPNARRRAVFRLRQWRSARLGWAQNRTSGSTRDRDPA